MIVGDLEHLADTLSTAENQVGTGKKGIFGCDNHEIEGAIEGMVTRAEWGARPPKTAADPMASSQVTRIISGAWRYLKIPLIPG